LQGRRRRRQHRAAPAPAAALLERLGHADRAVDRAVQAGGPADRAAFADGRRPLHVQPGGAAGHPTHPGLARRVLPGEGGGAGPRLSERIPSRALLVLVLLAWLVGPGVGSEAAGDWRIFAGGWSVAGHFRTPYGVAVDADANVYVADTENHRVQKLTPDGQPLAQWGSFGTGPGQFQRPSGVAIDGTGNVYVADTDNN